MFFLTTFAAEIVHIPQKHWTSDSHEVARELDDITESQLMILEELKKASPAIVVVEGRTEGTLLRIKEITYKLGSDENISQAYSRLYPKGLPKHGDKLSYEQKDFLIRVGAPELLYVSGHKGIFLEAGESRDPKFYKNFSHKALKKEYPFDSIAMAYDPSYSDFVFDARNKFAFDAAVKESKEYPSFNIFIVYGANHDFSSLAKQTNIPFRRLDLGSSYVSKRELAASAKPEDLGLNIYESIHFISRARFDKRHTSKQRSNAWIEQDRLLDKAIKDGDRLDPDIIPALLSYKLRVKALKLIKTEKIGNLDHHIMDQDMFYQLMGNPTPLAPTDDMKKDKAVEAAKTHLSPKGKAQLLLDSVGIDSNNKFNCLEKISASQNP
jgi:hypothetical protein